MSINKVFLVGNLTRDPELRQTAGGMSVLTFGMAVNDRVKNRQTGEWEDRPNFIDCTMFGSRAESVQKYIHKGNKVSVEGKLHWSQWEKDGQKRTKLDVTVDDIEFMSQPSAAQGAPQTAYQQPTAQPYQSAMPVPQQPAQPYVSYYEEDIAF